MDQHFITVFEIAQKHPNWEFITTPLIGFLVACIFAGWELATKRRTKFIAVAALLAFICFIVAFGSYRGSTYGLKEAQQLLRDGSFSTVEGRVTDFIPMPAWGHGMEQFTVSGVHFSYSDYVLVPCFNNTTSHGGPIKPDIWVRLSYYDDCILRIEVWQPSDQSRSN
jgi:hypothetical protein